jgi:hypothetical protein
LLFNGGKAGIEIDVEDGGGLGVEVEVDAAGVFGRSRML